MVLCVFFEQVVVGTNLYIYSVNVIGLFHNILFYSQEKCMRSLAWGFRYTSRDWFYTATRIFKIRDFNE